MKFLEAQKLTKAAAPTGENKMLPGSRTDQLGSTHQATTTPPKHSDAVTALAQSLGIDLKHVAPTGKNNSVSLADVRKAAADRDALNTKNLPTSALTEGAN
jgi:pyruvate/2-oxoglutarate dehydrogenase complex dihydrolipoamide acyltransferase (E2) component